MTEKIEDIENKFILSEKFKASFDRDSKTLAWNSEQGGTFRYAFDARDLVPGEDETIKPFFAVLMDNDPDLKNPEGFLNNLAAYISGPGWHGADGIEALFKVPCEYLEALRGCYDAYVKLASGNCDERDDPEVPEARKTSGGLTT